MKTNFAKFCEKTEVDKYYNHPDLERNFNSVFRKGKESLKSFNVSDEFILNEMISEFNNSMYHEKLAPHWIACLRPNCSWAGLLGMCVRNLKAKCL